MKKRVGILFNPRLDSARSLVGELEGRVRTAGAEAWKCSAHEEVKAKSLMPGTELLFSLGGDGTILRAARIAIPWCVPIVGVNLGRVGFIAEVDPEGLRQKLDSFLSGEGWIDERAMVRAVLPRGGDGVAMDGLNDVVVARGSAARVVSIRVSIDGEALTAFKGDGVIVASATGSTGYSFSAGGPILHPTSRDLVLQPLAPHLGWRASLVLPPEAKVELEVTADHPAIMSLDGQVDLPLPEGDRVEVRLSPYTVRFLRAEPPGYFYRSLERRLNPARS